MGFTTQNPSSLLSRVSGAVLAKAQLVTERGHKILLKIIGSPWQEGGG